MALTVERRNEIAWLVSVHRHSKESLPVKTLEEHCNELSTKFNLKNNQDLREYTIILLDTVFSKVTQGIWECKTAAPTSLSTERRNQLAWEILIAERFKSGLRIGESLRRELGNAAKEAQKLGISKSETYDFFHEVFFEITQKVINFLKK